MTDQPPSKSSPTTSAEITPVVHACPHDGSGLMPCCGKTPFEVPPTDGMALRRDAVTCGKATQPSEHYPPVKGHRIIPTDRYDCRYECTCGMPLGHTRAESVRLHRAHKVNLYAEAGRDRLRDDAPQTVTYQEAILEGADPTEGFYGD